MANSISNIIKKNLGLTPEVNKNQFDSLKISNDYFHKINLEKKEAKKQPIPIEKLKSIFLEKANEITGNFIINDENKDVINTLFYYFTSNELFYNNNVISNEASLKKGILLIGNTGSGKTTILDVFKAIKWQGFRKFSTYDVIEDFEKEGEKGIITYFKGNIYFDDLGAEQEAYFYGKRENVGTRLIEKRYNNYIREGLKTHATTNLSTKQITEKYGFRIEGRILEMFNIIYLGKNKNSIDFRILKHK